MGRSCWLFCVCLALGSAAFASSDLQEPVDLNRRIEASLSGVVRLDTTYVGEYGLSLSGLYHYNRVLAFRAEGAYLPWHSESSFADTVQPYGYVPSITTQFRMPWFALFAVQIAPFYGRLSLFDRDLGAFEAFGVVGMGAAGRELIGVPDYPRKVCVLGSFGVGVNWLFDNHIGLSLQIDDLVQERYQNTDGVISSNWMLKAGLRYVL